MTIYTIAFSLFLLMDSIGNVPIFISLLKEINPARQRKIIFRELLIALFVMIIFYFLGDGLLRALNVNLQTVMISGGVILFLIALRMIFPTEKALEGNGKNKDPFIVPLAIPLVAGPGVLASIMLYAHTSTLSWTIVLGAIFLAWIPTALILISSSWLQRLLGKRVLAACERLMGLILTLIAVQMFLEGLKSSMTS
jgi:multiple antibiotic resistance protein